MENQKLQKEIEKQVMTRKLLFMKKSQTMINYVSIVEGTYTSESMDPRPYLHTLQYRLRSLLSFVTLLFL